MKREYDVKRSKLEEALIRNRRDLLRINLQIDKIIRGPGETRDQFIQLMMENDDIVQTLRLMEGGVYDDSKLEEFGFVPYHFSPISRIHGLNFWTIDVPDRKCGILLIPKEVCHWCNCQRHQVRHSIMILEAKLHPWGLGSSSCWRTVRTNHFAAPGTYLFATRKKEYQRNYVPWISEKTLVWQDGFWKDRLGGGMQPWRWGIPQLHVLSTSGVSRIVDCFKDPSFGGGL